MHSVWIKILEVMGERIGICIAIEPRASVAGSPAATLD
jgi:hypothetical protein